MDRKGSLTHLNSALCAPASFFSNFDRSDFTFPKPVAIDGLLLFDGIIVAIMRDYSDGVVLRVLQLRRGALKSQHSIENIRKECGQLSLIGKLQIQLRCSLQHGAGKSGSTPYQL